MSKGKLDRSIGSLNRAVGNASSFLEEYEHASQTRRLVISLKLSRLKSEILSLETKIQAAGVKISSYSSNVEGWLRS